MFLVNVYIDRYTRKGHFLPHQKLKCENMFYVITYVCEIKCFGKVEI